MMGVGVGIDIKYLVGYLFNIILNVFIFCNKWKIQIPLKLASSNLFRTFNFQVNISQQSKAGKINNYYRLLSCYFSIH